MVQTNPLIFYVLVVLCRDFCPLGDEGSDVKNFILMYYFYHSWIEVSIGKPSPSSGEYFWSGVRFWWGIRFGLFRCPVRSGVRSGPVFDMGRRPAWSGVRFSCVVRFRPVSGFVSGFGFLRCSVRFRVLVAMRRPIWPDVRFRLVFVLVPGSVWPGARFVPVFGLALCSV